MMPSKLQDIYNLIALRVILQQGELVGTLAWQVARQVEGLNVQEGLKQCTIPRKEPKSTIDDLVNKYQKLFGKMASDVCRNAVADILADMAVNDVPESLI